jgi:hypothetical protein
VTQETTYYNDRGVTVTSTRLETPGQMFAMANITSVRAEYRTSWGAAGFLMLVGALIAYVAVQSGGGGGLVCGGITLLFGLVLGLLGTSTVLHVATASGEVKALRHSDRKFIEDVATAIKTAIIRRG